MRDVAGSGWKIVEIGRPLGTGVRERELLKLLEMAHRLISDPADFNGIRYRDRLKWGLAADIVILDPATVGSSNRGERRYNLPGGGKRMVMPSRGMRYVIVNGVTTYADGQLVGASAGRMLRS
jgi:N-acyl-D-amino-acid deacylase